MSASTNGGTRDDATITLDRERATTGRFDGARGRGAHFMRSIFSDRCLFPSSSARGDERGGRRQRRRWGRDGGRERCDGGGGGSFAALAHRATDRSARRSRGASRPSARARPRRGCGRTACSGARGARGGCGRPWRPVATRGGAARCGRVASSENAHSLHSAARKQTSSSPRRFFEPQPRRAGTRPDAARPWTIDRSSECGAGRSSAMKP